LIRHPEFWKRSSRDGDRRDLVLRASVLVPLLRAIGAVDAIDPERARGTGVALLSVRAAAFRGDVERRRRGRRPSLDEVLIPKRLTERVKE
jgi:hypothetical protein